MREADALPDARSSFFVLDLSVILPSSRETAQCPRSSLRFHTGIYMLTMGAELVPTCLHQRGCERIHQDDAIASRLSTHWGGEMTKVD